MTDHVSRQIAREWWKAHVETGAEVDIKQLARRASLELRQDPAFCAAFVEDFLESTMYEMGQRLIAAHRASLRTTAVLRQQVEADAKREEDRWARWLEYDPETGVHVPILNMTREQVVAAAHYRVSMAEQNAYDAKWLRLIAKELRPGQQVGDVLTGERLMELRESLKPTQIKKAA